MRCPSDITITALAAAAGVAVWLGPGAACVSAQADAAAAQTDAAAEPDDLPAPARDYDASVLDAHTPDLSLAVPEESSRFRPQGVEFGLHIGVHTFLSPRARLFLSRGEEGPRVMNPGPQLELYGGYRAVRWVSFGVHAQATYFPPRAAGWDQNYPGAGHTFAGSAGVYLRGHTAATDHPGLVDVWLLTGFHPLAALFSFANNAPDTRVQAMVVPLKLGATVQMTRYFGLEAALGMMAWLPLSYCVQTALENQCVDGNRRVELSSNFTVGVTWF